MEKSKKKAKELSRPIRDNIMEKLKTKAKKTKL